MNIAVRLDRVETGQGDWKATFDTGFAQGSLNVIIGPSGAGKSTLLNLIAGFLPVRRGRVLVDGADITAAPPGERPIAMLFQENNLFAHLTAARNVGLGIHARLRHTPEETARIGEALGAVGLEGLGARKPGELSGGQRQRVALARALISQRPILLLDEPFAALGPAQRLTMVALVDRLRRRRGLTVLMVSHQVDDVRGLDGRALFVDEGAIKADTTIQVMLEEPPEAARAYLKPA